MIVAVFGLPGSGKSYFARKLAERLEGTYISSDSLRRELFNSPTYSHDEKLAVYRKMLAIMYDYLHRREPLVMDATFFTREIRDPFNHEAESIGCRIAWIEIRAEDTLIRTRLNVNRPESDADYPIHLLIKKNFQPMRREHLTLDSTNENLDEMIKRALKYLEDFKPATTVKN
ncbi:AAA family ATPase [Fulvivirga sedimenti]|uniref:ATP-binding protein n=1 Tax=Fulvivirga sedimenti TaxID=2879465 RepID=A0A9X1HPU2_9BACT|nr:ATP-binding protein [Fulvivirga sedimenti]MCA6074543.1 ATP-binding protein [Fulvivirga sedimenti]MCA6075720.1 ATP-binding protein [Fulvivirga sedimenti]MCA6076848.1 ATP-binding protein [Fulvivirga sedimenti]